MRLLGTERDEICGSARCRPAQKEKPTKRRHRVLRVRTSTIVLQCQRCHRKKILKIRRLDLIRKVGRK